MKPLKGKRTIIINKLKNRIMKFLQFFKNQTLILIELIALPITVFWCLISQNIEAAISMISLFVTLTASFSLNAFLRPRIELSITNSDYGRGDARIIANNPGIINAGAADINMHYTLSWNYTIEIRNNSSKVAYSIDFEYQNMPQNSYVINEFKKESILANDAKTFQLKLSENIEATPDEADKHLKEVKRKIESDTKIILKYKDEAGSTYYTKFIWGEKKNILYSYYSLRKLCYWIKSKTNRKLTAPCPVGGIKPK
jgi:hypothetical protein